MTYMACIIFLLESTDLHQSYRVFQLGAVDNTNRASENIGCLINLIRNE